MRDIIRMNLMRNVHQTQDWSLFFREVIIIVKREKILICKEMQILLR